MQNPEIDYQQSKMFHASKLWSSNVYGGAVAGIGAAILISVMVGLVAWLAPTPKTFMFAGGLILTMIGTLVGLFPGNLIAATPYAVGLEKGKGLCLYAPLKKVYVPIQDVKEVQNSFFRQGSVVKLNRRHGLLKGFSIHGGFGLQGQQLVRAIQDEIARKG